MKVAVYARVSTKDKDQNPDVQLVPMREFCQRAGWEIVLDETDHASALDLSNRTGWTKIMEAARLHYIDLILLLRLDRAFRSVKHGVDTMTLLEAWNVSLKTLVGDIDTSTAIGRAFIHMSLTWAELERDGTAERIKAGMERAKLEGKRMGRPKGSKDKNRRRRRGYFKRYAE